MKCYIVLQEEFRRLKVLRAGGKVRGVSVAAASADTATLSVLTANNIVEQGQDSIGKLRHDYSVEQKSPCHVE